MNKYQLYTLGGAMLAASSLSSAAYATAIGSYNAGATTFTAGAIKIDDLLFSTTAATANAVVFGNTTGTIAVPGFKFSNAYSAAFLNANNLKISIPATGATFTNITSTSVNFIVTKGANTAVVGAATINLAQANPTISSLGGTLFVTDMQLTTGGGSLSVGGISALGANITGIEIVGDVFTNASGLATNGSVALALTIADTSNSSNVYESLASTAIITGAAPISTVITTGSSLSANGNATIPFSNFTSGSNSITLATVSITSTGTLGTNLTTVIDADGSLAGAGVATSVSISLANVAALQDTTANPTLVVVTDNGAHVETFNTLTYTPAAFTTGAVTFTIPASSIFDGSLSIDLTYTGTTVISAATAGTAAVNFTANPVQAIQTPAGVAATPTAAITRSGLTSQANWATDAASGLPSYLRIHNTGTAAGTATIVVKLDAQTVGGTVSTLGTYTTASVPAGGTIQVGVPTIETALAITPSANNSYTLLVTGAFPGYLQHLQLTPSNTLMDLDGFRNGGLTSSAP